MANSHNHTLNKYIYIILHWNVLTQNQKLHPQTNTQNMEKGLWFIEMHQKLNLFDHNEIAKLKSMYIWAWELLVSIFTQNYKDL